MIAALLAMLVPTDIPAAVADAIASGAHSYQLPDGSVPITAPIVIPAGTRDFTLLGGRGTVLTTPSHFEHQAIRVGNQPVLSDNWWITGPSNIPCDPVPYGQAWVHASRSVPLGYAVLWDDHRIVCAKGPNSSMNHAEIVRVTAYDPATGRATLDVKTGREYLGNVMLAPYDTATCVDITVRNIAFDGATSDGSDTSEGLVMVGIADGVQILNCSAVNFRSDAIACTNSRNVVIASCNVKSASSGDAGSGYGFSIYRSRGVLVRGSNASGCRHGFIVHSGSMDVAIQSCTSPNGFDLHGFDERRVIISDSSGDGLDLGNDAWLAPPSDVRVTRCSITGDIGIHGGTRLLFTACSLGPVGLYSVEAGTTPTVGDPASESIQDVTFQGCSIANGGTCVNDQGAQTYGIVCFAQCSFVSQSTVLDLSYSGAVGTLQMTGCDFTTTSVDHIIQFHQLTGGSLQIRSCRLFGKGSLGVWARSDVAPGVVSIWNSTFYGGSTFMADDSGNVQSIGNSASQTRTSDYVPISGNPPAKRRAQ